MSNFIVDDGIWQPKEEKPFAEKKVCYANSSHSKEADLSATIVKKLNEVKERKVRCQKAHGGPYGKATLDIFGSCDGMFFWLEVKKPGEKPTVRQRKTMKTWIEDGAVATWTTSVKAAIEFINSDFKQLTQKKMMEGFHEPS